MSLDAMSGGRIQYAQMMLFFFGYRSFSGVTGIAAQDSVHQIAGLEKSGDECGLS